MDTSRLKQLASELRQKTEMEKSMKMARLRQLHMLPKMPVVEGYEFKGIYLPCANVSGDFYDFIKVSEHEIGIAMGDVSGHGIEAGIIMGMAKKALQIYARGLSSPKQALALTNSDLGKDLDGETFVSAAYGVLDTHNHIFRFSRAGNNPPYLVNPARNPQIREIRPNGMVIGVDKLGKHFGVVTQEEVIQLQPGDLFFQYTDGLVEAPNRDKAEFGAEKVKDLLLKNHHRSVSDLVDLLEESVQSHIGSVEQEDDVTMIAFRLNGK
ncbi:MAG TPA: SpoIIE family protein phosphatase [Planctomycetota bacterium]|nr:SpoIIE family protein phosphatase [Planctomycetota bacterium]